MTTYTYEEALKASEEYFDEEQLPAKVWIDKYALRDAENNLLEKIPTDMFDRLATKLAKIEKKKFENPLSKEEIYNYLDGFKKIILQGSIMYGLNNPYKYISLANCVSLPPVEDSYGGILFNDELIVQTAKRRMGAGFDLSKLRPENHPTTNSSNTSTGIISWMKRYSQAVREVGQHGRRGALLMMIDVRHPQILDFVKVKQNLEDVTGANISVKLCDEFMEAVEKNTTYEQRWPINTETPEISVEIEAREVWNEIVKNARNHAEPGLLFWDTILKESVADCYPYFETVGTNGCSELPMNGGGGCILLTINLYNYVKNKFQKNAEFDFEEFSNDCKILQRLADNIVDAELECIKKIQKKIEQDPEPEEVKKTERLLWQIIHDSTELGRRTGCGTTALGDCFAALGIGYGSKKSVKLADKIYQTLKLSCYESSVDMAKELGPFPMFDKDLEKDNPFLSRIKEEDPTLYNRMRRYGRRNIACLTNSPAGSISILSQTTSGIEPLLYLTSIRRKKGNPGDKDFRVDYIDQNGDSWMEFEVTHPRLKDWTKTVGDEDISKSPWVGCTAQELDYNKRINLQSTIQNHIDHNISNTINLPKDITEEEVSNIYIQAWKNGLKGITIYREGSRSGVIVKERETKKRPKALPCDLYHIAVSGQRYFVLVGLMNGEPYEVFAGKNGHLDRRIKTGFIVKKKKTCYKAEFPEFDDELSPITASCNEQEEMITRLTSLALQSGASIHKVVVQLEKVGERNDDINCYSRSIARALKKYIPENTAEEDLCPKCNGKLERIGGCPTCRNPQCGWSRCL